MAVNTYDDYFMYTLSDIGSSHLFLYFALQGIYKKKLLSNSLSSVSRETLIIVCDVEKHKISFLPSLYYTVYRNVWVIG